MLINNSRGMPNRKSPRRDSLPIYMNRKNERDSSELITIQNFRFNQIVTMIHDSHLNRTNSIAIQMLNHKSLIMIHI